MLLFELFGDETSPICNRDNIGKIEETLNKTLFCPRNKLLSDEPAIRLELPTYSYGDRENHFLQRLEERQFTVNELTDVLHKLYRAFQPILIDLRINHKEHINVSYSYKFDDIVIPIIVKPNFTQCVAYKKNSYLCMQPNDMVGPKFKIKVKTIIRKDNQNNRVSMF